MILDHIPKTGAFVLRVPRGEGDLRALMTQVGLDFSESASTTEEAVLFTREPCAALCFWDCATPGARRQLETLNAAVEASWRQASNGHICMPDDKELWPFQIAGVEFALQRRNVLIGDQPGLGKCCDINSLALTPSGWRRMGDLCVGDYVIGADGRPTRILGVFPQGVKPAYSIVLKDGTATVVCGEHLWAVRNQNHKKRGGHWRLRTTAQLVAGKPSQYEIPVMVPLVRPALGPAIDPYILGVLIGDGSLGGGQAEWATPDFDKDIVTRVQDRLQSGYAISRYDKACPHYAIVGGGHKNNQYRHEIKRLGLNCLSADKFIPEEYKWASIEERLDLLRGLMDTDGSCVKNRTTFHTVSPKLAADVAGLVRSLGGVAKERWYDRSHEGKPAECQVTVRLNECPFYTARKVAQWRPPEGSHRVCRYIDRIEQVEDREQVCIKVENPDGLFVVNDFIVTHNTPQAICVANEMGAKRILVVCPANIRLQWEAQIKAWSTMRQPIRPYLIRKSRDGVSPTMPWTITSYDLLRNPAIHHALMQGSYDLLIIDEGHHLKTPDAARTRALFGGGGVEPLAGRAAKVVVLTGTPLPNRPSEAWTITKALCHEAIDWMSYDAYRHRFNPVNVKTVEKINPQTGVIYNVRFSDERSGRLGELQNRLRSTFMVRRMKRDVLTQLPSVMHEIIHVEDTADVRKAREAEDLLHIDPDTLEFQDKQSFGQWPVVRHQMGDAIAPLAAEYADTLLDGGVDKLVIFGWHISVLDIIEAALRKAGHALVRVDGRTPMHARTRAVESFIRDDRIRVFLGNIQAIGVGVDGLQNAASHALFAEFSTVPGENQQAIDRLHRIGQANSVLAQFLLSPGSLGEKIVEKWLTKLQTVHASLDKEFV